MTFPSPLAPKLLIGLICALFLGCGATSKAPGTPSIEPDWVRSPENHPASQSGEYLCALGSAKGRGASARDTALKRGLQNIAASILADVKSDVMTVTESLVTESQATWSEQLVERIQVGAEAELPGAEVLESYESSRPGETVLLVGVRRADLVKNWLPELDAALNAAQELARSADEQPAADLTRRLVALGRAQATVSGAWILANKLRVVASGTPQGRFVEGSWNEIAGLMTSLSTDLTRTASQIRLTVVSGDGQAGRVRGALAAPLVVRAERLAADGSVRPVPGLPLSFVPSQPGMASVQAEGAQTDADGSLSAQISGLNRAGDAPLEIRAMPSLGDDLAPPPGLPVAVFQFSLPAASDTRVMVVVSEEFDGKALASSTMAQGLAGHLGSYGFDAQLLEPNDPRYALLLEQPVDQLADQLSGDVDYVLRGRAPIRTSGFSSGLHWFRGRGVLEIVDLHDGSVLPLATEEVKDAHSTAGEEGMHRVVRRGLLPKLYELLDQHFIVSFVGESELR